MSKTLTGILEIAVGTALEFIPGFQALGTSLILTGVATTVSGLFQHTDKPQQTETAIKSPTPERASGYGRNRFHMAYVLYTSDSEGTAIDVGVFHDGKVDGIERFYLGDKQVTFDGDGWIYPTADGQFGVHTIQIGTRLGNPAETAFSQIVALVPDQWTTDHRGDGCVTGFVQSRPVKMSKYSLVYPGGTPDGTPLSLAMRLQLCFDWRDTSQNLSDPTTWKWTENAILHLAHYLLVRDNKNWSLHFGPTLSYWTAAANVCDEAIPLAGVQTVLSTAANHGATSITVTAIDGLASGMTIVISATGDTSLTETRTVGSISGTTIAFSGGLSNDHPQGSQVTWASSSESPATEPRYRSCVAHKHTDAHKAVKTSILACCDGWLSPRADGALVVYAGKYVEPDTTLGPDEIVSYSLQDGIDEENAINQIAVSYVSANHDFNVVDTDAWQDDEDIMSRGKVLADTLANQVPSHSQGRRLAKRKLSQTMAPKRGTTTTNAVGRAKVLGKRFVRQQLIDAGAEFLDDVIEITKLTRNLGTGGVTFEWILADPNVDAWNPATEEGLPAPVGNRVALAPLDAPTINSAVADFSAVADGGTGVRLTINATGPDRSDVQWYARWRVLGDVSWNEQQYPDTDPGSSVVLETAYVPTQSTVEVEVAYGTGDGRLSAYSSAVNADTATDATAPDAADAITLVSWSDALNLATGRIARATSYRWRFYDPGALSTPIRTIVTSTPAVSYTAAQAGTDGARRDYVATVAGVNAGGAGTAANTSTLTLAAPPTVTGFSAADGTTESAVTFDLSTASGVAGYLIAISTVSGFDPLTQGTLFRVNGSPAYLQNLAAGVFYAKMAAYDAWTARPDLLNFTSEDGFTISTGGGGVGGGGGDGGGGYCVTTDTSILMADGSEKAAEDVRPGDMLRTQPELPDGSIGAWGNYPVTAISFVEDDVFALDIGTGRLRATAGHRMMIGGSWVRMDAVGSPDGRSTVAQITVGDAHTYVSAGVLSHNIKPIES